MKGTFFQWALLTLMMTWGIFSFLVLASDASPDEQETFIQFITIKAAALISLLSCVAVTRWLDSNGNLPDIEED